MENYIMKSKLKIILTIILLIGIALFVWLFNKHEQEKEQIKEEEALYLEYKGTADRLRMNLDKSVYQQTDNLEDLILVPTEFTYKLFERWKSISEIFPEIDYPERTIQQENWLAVHEILSSNWAEMENASNKLNEEVETGEYIDSRSIAGYIYKKEIYNESFREFLEKKGIMEPE